MPQPGHPPGQHQRHVLPATLEHLYVALLLAKHHVAVVPVVGGSEGAWFRVHLDECFATWLALRLQITLNKEPDLNYIEIFFHAPHSLNYLWKNFKVIHDGSLVELNQANISLAV